MAKNTKAAKMTRCTITLEHGRAPCAQRDDGNEEREREEHTFFLAKSEREWLSNKDRHNRHGWDR